HFHPLFALAKKPLSSPNPPLTMPSLSKSVIYLGKSFLKIDVIYFGEFLSSILNDKIHQILSR
ncbi:MAG: hypothetical protein MUF71_05600, partial [Candidatus Kapabacteria bacterium]|nr:hypothetical protein [Candidatus Kapabacteria bacterium]